MALVTDPLLATDNWQDTCEKRCIEVSSVHVHVSILP